MILKKRLLKNLIVSLVLISFACAHVNNSEKVEEYNGYVKVEHGILPIDPENPPINGVWMSWEDAIAMANNKRKERREFLVLGERLKLDKELTQARLEKTETQLKEAESPMGKFWKTWGFPIGIILGFGIGFGTFFLVR